MVWSFRVWDRRLEPPFQLAVRLLYLAGGAPFTFSPQVTAEGAPSFRLLEGWEPLMSTRLFWKCGKYGEIRGHDTYSPSH
jgi:hypothetical protein